jgi:hypothetical protein
MRNVGVFVYIQYFGLETARECIGDLIIDERIILKFIIEKWDAKM